MYSIDQHFKNVTEYEWGFLIRYDTATVLNNFNSLQFAKKIVNICKSSHKYRVIIDATFVKRQISILNFLTISEFFQKECPGIRIAIIAPHLSNAEGSKSMELFAANRGSFVSYFDSIDQAITWVLD